VHDDAEPALTASSHDLFERVPDPDELSDTIPVGANVLAVSVTVAVHAVVSPTGTGFGEQLTTVCVASWAADAHAAGTGVSTQPDTTPSIKASPTNRPAFIPAPDSLAPPVPCAAIIHPTSSPSAISRQPRWTPARS